MASPLVPRRPSRSPGRARSSGTAPSSLRAGNRTAPRGRRRRRGVAAGLTAAKKTGHGALAPCPVKRRLVRVSRSDDYSAGRHADRDGWLSSRSGSRSAPCRAAAVRSARIARRRSGPARRRSPAGTDRACPGPGRHTASRRYRWRDTAPWHPRRAARSRPRRYRVGEGCRPSPGRPRGRRPRLCCRRRRSCLA